MKGLIVSTNPLFIEVVSEALTHYFTDGYVLVNPKYIAERLSGHTPGVILIDESMPLDLFSQSLYAARQLPEAHILLINPGSNDCVVLNSYRANITNLEDIMNVMSPETIQGEANIARNPYAQMQENALAKAGMYNFFASVLNQRPDTNLVRNLRAIGVQTFLNILDEEVPPDLETGLSQMIAYLQATDAQPETQVEQDLAVDWTRLFRGVQPGYGPTPPYEVEYLGGSPDTSLALQRLMHEYAAAGAKVEAGAANRPDYLGLELAFASYLYSREADAWQAGDPALAEERACAALSFISRHPGKWIERFYEKAHPEARTDFYRGYLLVLKSILMT